MRLGRKRLGYLIATVLLLMIEVVIALFVRDVLVRPYVGDVLVVMVLYTFVRIFVPEKVSVLPLCVFLFAVFVEVLQAVHIVEILGLSDHRFFRVLLGSTFDWNDVVCYAIGCILIYGYESLYRRTVERKEK